MSNVSVAQITRRAEFIYAALALFALTQGPVYRLWSESATYLTTSPQPSIPHIYFATFVVLQLPAVLILSRKFDQPFLANRPLQWLIALLGWVGLSVTWSTLARQSLPEYLALVLTTSFGLYLAVRFTFLQLWRVIGVAMALGLVLSLFAIWRNWDLAVDREEKYWIGIYYNRNSLAPVAAMAVVAAFGIFVTTKNNFRFVLPYRLAALSLGAVALVVLWQSESKTAPLALIVAALAAAVWVSVRWLFVRTKFPKQAVTFAAMSTVVIAGLAIFVALRNIGEFTDKGETATFHSRSGLWSQNWTGFLEKPLFGWGWMAARYTEQFHRQGVWWGAFRTEWSHSGYYDLLLGGGILTAVLFTGVVLAGVRRFDVLEPLRAVIPLFLVVSFVLAAATQESFFIGSHFLWALLVAALFAGREVKSSLVDQHNASHITP